MPAAGAQVRMPRSALASGAARPARAAEGGEVDDGPFLGSVRAVPGRRHQRGKGRLPGQAGPPPPAAAAAQLGHGVVVEAGPPLGRLLIVVVAVAALFELDLAVVPAPRPPQPPAGAADDEAADVVDVDLHGHTPSRRPPRWRCSPPR